MTRIYEVSKPNQVSWIFIDNGKTKGEGYISYRNVICRALHHNKQKYEKQKIKQELFDPLRDAINNLKNIDISQFISVYFIPEDQNNVAFMVDRTKGCFPLMFENKNIRLIALQEAVNDINNVWGKIIEILYSHTNWTSDIEGELNLHYTHPEPKKLDFSTH